MRLLGNILWIIFGGFLSALGWGKDIRYEGEAVSFLLNVVWFLISGWILALGNFLIGVLLCVTIIGIPFGKQFFKIAKLSLRPFGAVVTRVNYL